MSFLDAEEPPGVDRRWIAFVLLAGAEDSEPMELTVQLRLVRLDARVPVVHKHRFWSSEGKMVWSLDGLQSEVDDDASSAAFTQFETFEVDYLEDDLRLKVTGGLIYNFTDTTDKTDALYVFHRETETMRERLGCGATPVRN